MNLMLCNKCRNRYVMCYKCEKNKYYTKGNLTHDEFVTKEAVKDFTKNIIEQLEELKTKRFVSGITSDPYEFGACHAIDIAIDVIRKAVQHERFDKQKRVDL